MILSGEGGSLGIVSEQPIRVDTVMLDDNAGDNIDDNDDDQPIFTVTDVQSLVPTSQPDVHSLAQTRQPQTSEGHTGGTGVTFHSLVVWDKAIEQARSTPSNSPHNGSPLHNITESDTTGMGSTHDFMRDSTWDPARKTTRHSARDFTRDSIQDSTRDCASGSAQDSTQDSMRRDSATGSTRRDSVISLEGLDSDLDDTCSLYSLDSETKHLLKDITPDQDVESVLIQPGLRCNICGESQKGFSALAKHLMGHVGEKPTHSENMNYRDPDYIETTARKLLKYAGKRAYNMAWRMMDKSGNRDLGMRIAEAMETHVDNTENNVVMSASAIEENSTVINEDINEGINKGIIEDINEDINKDINEGINEDDDDIDKYINEEYIEDTTEAMADEDNDDDDDDDCMLVDFTEARPRKTGVRETQQGQSDAMGSQQVQTGLIECLLCSARFRDTPSLMGHMQLHNALRSQCTGCHQFFPNSEQLEIHLSHTPHCRVRIKQSKS